LRLGKNQFEEEKNIIIREENKNLFYKIMSAREKPSKYSKIFEPKVCPSFNIKYIRIKRVNKLIENHNENERFYHHLENVKSFYDINDINKRNITIDSNMKKLQKSVLEMQPSIFFISPQNVKKSMKKITYINLNKNKIKRRRQPSNSSSSLDNSNKKKISFNSSDFESDHIIKRTKSFESLSSIKNDRSYFSSENTSFSPSYESEEIRENELLNTMKNIEKGKKYKYIINILLNIR
jgi:hypothetical protein